MCHSARRTRDRRPVEHRSHDDLLASDADRERTVSLLREHAAQGRLTMEELEQRTERALAARTGGDLRALRSDLPRLPRDRRRENRAEVAEHVRSYLSVMVLLLVIWAATGAGYFWPIWPMLGWGIGVLSHAAPVLRSRY